MVTNIKHSCHKEKYKCGTGSANFVFPLLFGLFQVSKIGLHIVLMTRAGRVNIINLRSANQIHKGWSPKFATGLNVIIGIAQKIYERPDCSFAKMVYF